MVTGLTPDNQQFLIHVVATGVFKSQEEALNQAVLALRESTEARPALVDEPSRPQDAKRESTEAWIARVRAWSDSHPAVEGFVDDSRESIYEGRGE
jgi:Arc/MetJ-type ribon-helix-helix transcriptional regulator